MPPSIEAFLYYANHSRFSNCPTCISPDDALKSYPTLFTRKYPPCPGLVHHIYIYIDAGGGIMHSSSNKLFIQFPRRYNTLIWVWVCHEGICPARQFVGSTVQPSFLSRRSSPYPRGQKSSRSPNLLIMEISISKDIPRSLSTLFVKFQRG